MRRARCDAGPDVAHQAVTPIVRVLGIELTDAVAELPDGRRPHQGPCFARGPVDAPLAGLRVVEAQGQSLDRPARPPHLHLLELGTAVPDLAGLRRAVELDPPLRARQRVHQPLHAKLPGAELEVEIMLSIVGAGHLRRAGANRYGA